MKERATGAAGARGRRRVLFFLATAAAWTLLSCYPNPGVLLRNLARYRRLPIDPGIERKMGWRLPADPGQVEMFVDSLLVPTPDWARYRVPWYVPTAAEAARSSHGDCEAKAILLASLLAGKGLPFEIRASLNHIWVDYPGRRPRAGESQELAYLEGERGRLRLHRPDRIAWGEVLTAQREQLWGAMPIARKALWLIGLLWAGLGAMLLGSAPAEGQLISQWRPRGVDYLWRWLWLSMLAFFLTAVGASFWPEAGRGGWKAVDLWEVLAMSAAGGGLVGWLSTRRRRRGVTVEEDGSRLLLSSSLGLWGSSRVLETAGIAHLELCASAGDIRPWAIAMVLRTGEHIPLLHYGRELAARAALRSLGLSLRRPLLVRSDGSEAWTMADEVGMSLRERAARRPPAAAPERPRGCVVEVAESDGVWVIGLPPPGRRAGLELAVIAAVPVAFLALATLGIWRFPGRFVFWAGWVAAMCFVSLVTYAAILVRVELTAYAAGARVEIGEGMLRHHTMEKKVEAVELDHIETVEVARRGETATLAVVSPERVLHISGLGQAEHREWVRRAIERAIAGAG